MAQSTQPDFLVRLGLDAGADSRNIKRAYARQLKLIDQESEPQRFGQLRADYQAALAWAGGAPLHSAPPGDPALQAARAFEQFSAACARLARGRMLEDSQLWQDALAHCLKDDGLLDLSARLLFEGRVAHLLAGGWRPGHEMLLGAASAVFGWDLERDRLRQFGYAGALVERALDERALAALQSEALQATQRKVMARLRRARAPDCEQLRRDMFYLEQMLLRFPTLLAMTADKDRVAQWKNLFRQMQAVRFQPFEVAQEAPASASARPRWPLLLAAMNFLRTPLI